jgi:hypothetical protein
LWQLALSIQLAFLFASACLGQGWSRDITDGGTLRDYPKVPFLIMTTSLIDDHLSAICAYQFVEGNAPLTLHGTKDSDGDFSPFVSYEIATKGTTEWKEIAKFESKNPVAIEIGSSNPRMGLHVDMDPFRPHIGKSHWGRVVLENGQATIFSLEDLLPTGNNPDKDGNFKQFTNDVEAKRLGSSYSMISVTSLSNQLVGDFIFIGGAKGSCVKIKGAATNDAVFWPSVTLQAGNSNHDWKTLGKSNNQKIEILQDFCNRSPWSEFRVALDPYKLVTNDFKYGKIIFSDGSFAVFELAKLKPH